MIRVKVTTVSPEWPVLQQTPGYSGIGVVRTLFVLVEIPDTTYSAL